MYAYVTCCPDIGYAITTMSKFSTKPSALHYHYLKQVTKYLCLTKDWGIKFKRTIECPELNEAKFWLEITLDDRPPAFLVDINQLKLIAFVDAAHTLMKFKKIVLQLFLYSHTVLVLLSTVLKHKQSLLWVPQKVIFLLLSHVSRLLSTCTPY